MRARRVAPRFWMTLVLALGYAHGQDRGCLQACTRLSDDRTRLSCYDAAMGMTKPATGASGSRASPACATQTDGQERFGDDGRLHTEPKAALPKNLTMRVLQAMSLPAGLYRLSLDNGQVWDTTQADSALAFQANDVVTISRLLLGGYQMSLAGHTTSVSAVRRR